MPKGNKHKTDSEILARLELFARPITPQELAESLRWNPGKVDGALRQRLIPAEKVHSVLLSPPQKGTPKRFIGLPHRDYWVPFSQEWVNEKKYLVIDDPHKIIPILHSEPNQFQTENFSNQITELQLQLSRLKRQLENKNLTINHLKQQLKDRPEELQFADESINHILQRVPDKFHFIQEAIQFYWEAQEEPVVVPAEEPVMIKPPPISNGSWRPPWRPS